MANNTFVSYDLHKPGQNYHAVIERIKAQGNWAKVTESQYYVSTTKTADQVATSVWQVMDANDTLIVVDTTNNTASWRNVLPEVAKFMQDHWGAGNRRYG